MVSHGSLLIVNQVVDAAIWMRVQGVQGIQWGDEDLLLAGVAASAPRHREASLARSDFALSRSAWRPTTSPDTSGLAEIVRPQSGSDFNNK